MSVRHLRGRRRSSEETKLQRNHLNPRSSPRRWPSWVPSGGCLLCSTSPRRWRWTRRSWPPTRRSPRTRLLSLPAWRCRRHGRRAHRHGRRGHRRHWWRGTTRRRRRPCRRAGVEQLASPHRAKLERRVAEPRACLGRQLAPSGQARLVKHGADSPVSGGLGGPPSRVICWRTAHRKPSEEWRKW